MFPVWFILVGLLSSTLPSVGEDLVEKAIAPHRGKVVVLNLWATWCGPCREEFPELVRFYEKHKPTTVLVAVSMDEPEDSEEVREYLRSYKSEFPSYIRGFKDFQAFADALDPKWRGAIPATFVFDKMGRLVHSREGKLTYNELERITAPYRGR